ncbi:helix-turn-helix domain-containing protein [Streptomyces solisilvae]|uniref:helix-turn-helix domain-containing protein n=1 Tax=Streptomyces malaysiensis TaxID=92644 RepID=UPI0036A6E530
MAPQKRSRSETGTLTAGQGPPARTASGIVCGHLLKIIRERIPLTQSRLAEELGIDTTTVQGWESGRRSLAAISSAQFLRLKRHLLGRGAEPTLLPLLDLAVEADSVIEYSLNDTLNSDDITQHPLHSWVFTRASTHMIAWALTGEQPTILPKAPASTPRRRGPTPGSPLLPTPQRDKLFANLRRTAEIADRVGEDGSLLRRQALYLCAYDTSVDTHSWLADMRESRQTPLRHASWTPAWSDARSVATSLTRYGDSETLQTFIERGMGGDASEMANLNYWAHWLGLDPVPRASDAFMSDVDGRSWEALPLLRNLADRLDPSLGAVDLNIHSVWALISSKPGVLSADRELHRDLTSRVDRLLDSDVISRQSRRELENVHYGLRLSSR